MLGSLKGSTIRIVIDIIILFGPYPEFLVHILEILISAEMQQDYDAPLNFLKKIKMITNPVWRVFELIDTSAFWKKKENTKGKGN